MRGRGLDDPAVRGDMAERTRRDEIRLWRDPALGRTGVELLAGSCFEHRYRPHFHDEIVIAAFTGGAQRHRVGRHRGVAGPGCVLIIPAGEMHTGEAEDEAGWSYRAFYPDELTLTALSDDLFGGARSGALDFGLAPLHGDHLLTPPADRPPSGRRASLERAASAAAGLRRRDGRGAAALCAARRRRRGSWALSRGPSTMLRHWPAPVLAIRRWRFRTWRRRRD